MRIDFNNALIILSLAGIILAGSLTIFSVTSIDLSYFFRFLLISLISRADRKNLKGLANEFYSFAESEYFSIPESEVKTKIRSKLEKNLGSITDMTRLPGALFVVDIRREHIAVREAQKLNIPIFAMVDTNCDPREVDFAIPSNDDASKSIDIILNYVSTAIKSGLSERQKEKEVAEVIKEKEDSSENNDGIKEVDEPKEKNKRTRVTKKTEE